MEIKRRTKTNPNEREVSNPPDAKLKVIVIKRLTDLGRRMHEYRTSAKRQKKKNQAPC